jgi:hypothetical protein
MAPRPGSCKRDLSGGLAAPSPSGALLWLRGRADLNALPTSTNLARKHQGQPLVPPDVLNRAAVSEQSRCDHVR